MSAHTPRGAFPVAAILLLALVSSLPAAAQPKVATPVWRTYLGGGGSDRIKALAIADDGDIVVVGSTTSQDLAPNGAVTELAAPDAFMARFSSTGTLKKRMGFGGSGEDEALGVAVSPTTGDVYIVGRTRSSTVTGAGAVHNGYLSSEDDAFLSKVKADGTPEWFAYLAGNTGTDVATSVAISATGAVYVAGSTSSANIAGGQGGISGGGDGFILKMGVSSANANTPPSVDGRRILGGGQADGFSGITIDSDNFVVVVGTTSSDFFTGYSDLLGDNDVGPDVLIARFDLSTTSRPGEWIRFVGSPGDDEGASVVPTTDGQLVAVGSTTSASFTDSQATTPAGKNALLIWLKTTGELNRVEVLGGDSADEGRWVAIDRSNNVYAAGKTSSPALARTHPFDDTLESGAQAQDGFVAMVPAQGRGWFSYVGGDGVDEVSAIGIRSSGSQNDLVLAGQVTSGSNFFPGVSSTYDSSLSLKEDGYIVSLSLTDVTPPSGGTVEPAASQTATSTTISASWRDFQEQESSIVGYEWAILQVNEPPTPPTPLQDFTAATGFQASHPFEPPLQTGLTYFVAVRAHNSSGLVREVHSADVVVPAPSEGGPDGGTGNPDGGMEPPDGGGTDGGTGGGKSGDKDSPLGWGCAATGGAGIPLLLGLIAFVLLGRRLGQPSR